MDVDDPGTSRTDTKRKAKPGPEEANQNKKLHVSKDVQNEEKLKDDPRSTNTFKKRPGTTNHGAEYEEIVIAQLLLKLISDPTNPNFKLSSNVENFSSFDIILEQATKTYAIQIKHSKKTLTDLANFVAEYYKAFQNIKHITPLELVFFTNMDFSPYTFQYNSLQITVKAYVHELFQSDFCYRFEITASEDVEERDKYQDFFNKFYLVTNQPHVVEAKKILVAKFQENFSSNCDDAEKFFKSIKLWSDCEERKEKLNRTYVEQIISLCMLERFIKPMPFSNDQAPYRAQLLRKAIESFDVTVLQTEVVENFNEIQRLWNDLDLIADDREKLKKKFYLSIYENDRDMETTKMLWLMGKCPLIICKSPASDKAIQLWPHHKFLLVTNCFEKPHLSFATLADMDPNSALYENIIQEFTISIQGKKELTLKSLLQEHIIFKDILTPRELLKMVGNPYCLGEQEAVCQPYISRWLSDHRISINYLNNIDKNTLIVLDCRNKIDKIKHRIGNFNLYDISLSVRENNVDTPLCYGTPCLKNYVTGPDLSISPNFCLPKEFIAICENNLNVENCHHLMIVDESTLKWTRSKGDTIDLEGYRFKDSFIAERTFYNKQPENKMNLLIADPGMGKSQLLKNIFNKAPPKLWTVYMQSKDTTALCAANCKLTVETFMDFLINTKYSKYGMFEKKMIRLLVETDQVVFLWDALDEINFASVNKIVTLIQELSTKSCFQWVTARSHLKRQLEKQFNVMARNIKQLSENEQINFIETRLKNCSSREEVTDVIAKIKPIISLFKHNDVLAVPLQICMLTELFQRDRRKYLELLQTDCISFLASLFLHIIDEKFNRFYEEKVKISNRPTQAMKQVLDNYKRCRLKKYQKVALKLLITEEFCQQHNIKCDQFLDAIEDEADGIGLITEVTNKCPQFLHNSFAEFFVAMYFTKESRKSDFKNITFGGNYVNIQFFYDVLTSKNSSVHIGVLYKNIEFVKQHKADLKKHRDEDDKCALQLACSYGQRFPQLSVAKQEEGFIINNDNDNLLTGESNEYKNIFRYLLDQFSIQKCDDEYINSLLDYADKSECLWTTLEVLSALKSKKLNHDDKSVNLLYYSVKFGYKKVFKLFHQIPLIKITKDATSLLHVAVAHDQRECLKKLLEVELYREAINVPDITGATPLFNACRNGLHPIAELLIDHNADFNACKKDGTSPLHTACLHHQLNIIKLLLNHGDNINKVKNFGITPLHVASWNGHNEVVQLLLENDQIDVDAEDAEGCTPLYVAARNNQDAVLDSLIKYGADINHAQKDGVTPLFIASQEGHERNVKLLLSTKRANINHFIKSGETLVECALSIAMKHGHANIVEMLKQANAVEPL